MAWAGISVPAAWVEPAIAATIVGMALFDAWSRRQTQPVSVRWRLLLVFLCALVHGLGLANALADLHLDSGHLWLTLAGFNLGIESAQVLIAAAALALLALVRAVKGPDGVRLATRLTSLLAMVVGSLWFVQRAVQFA